MKLSMQDRCHLCMLKFFKVGGDSIACVSLFGYPEKIAVQAVESRERIERELLLK